MLSQIAQRFPPTLELDLKCLSEIGSENRSYFYWPHLNRDELPLFEAQPFDFFPRDSNDEAVAAPT